MLQDFAVIDALAANYHAAKQSQAVAQQHCINRVSWQPDKPFTNDVPFLDGSSSYQPSSRPQPVPVYSSLHTRVMTQAPLQQYMNLKPACSLRPPLQDQPSDAPQQLPPSSCHLQVKNAHASGILANDCIDLLSQPGQTEEEVVVLHVPTGQQPSGPYSRMNAATDVHSNTADIHENCLNSDTSPLEELMTCSTNLLNPGIRVHKYSDALFWSFLMCSPAVSACSCQSWCLVALSVHAAAVKPCFCMQATVAMT